MEKEEAVKEEGVVDAEDEDAEASEDESAVGFAVASASSSWCSSRAEKARYMKLRTSGCKSFVISSDCLCPEVSSDETM